MKRCDNSLAPAESALQVEAINHVTEQNGLDEFAKFASRRSSSDSEMRLKDTVDLSSNVADHIWLAFEIKLQNGCQAIRSTIHLYQGGSHAHAPLQHTSATREAEYVAALRSEYTGLDSASPPIYRQGIGSDSSEVLSRWMEASPRSLSP